MESLIFFFKEAYRLEAVTVIKSAAGVRWFHQQFFGHLHSYKPLMEPDDHQNAATGRSNWDAFLFPSTLLQGHLTQFKATCCCTIPSTHTYSTLMNLHKLNEIKPMLLLFSFIPSHVSVYPEVWNIMVWCEWGLKMWSGKDNHTTGD